MTQQPILLHRPGGSLWLCILCGYDWPCGQARVELAEEFRDDFPGLAVYLAAQLHAAMDDLMGGPDVTAAGLTNRFLGWARPLRYAQWHCGPCQPARSVK
ncbi:hypothetical protein [Asanoa siamensis]|uniref:Uncharacterized protein n=1 Tax=Asanoa siamensis TaxID=926357 RepID=A0ABQ4CJE9_9ACTN|nr:hypothetical protein [Asanoa siamensis]GIF70972.1 hypothetical protein Asi02nite_04900 [Asanoa siamensis]